MDLAKVFPQAMLRCTTYGQGGRVLLLDADYPNTQAGTTGPGMRVLL